MQFCLQALIDRFGKFFFMSCQNKQMHHLYEFCLEIVSYKQLGIVEFNNALCILYVICMGLQKCWSPYIFFAVFRAILCTEQNLYPKFCKQEAKSVTGYPTECPVRKPKDAILSHSRNLLYTLENCGSLKTLQIFTFKARKRKPYG